MVDVQIIEQMMQKIERSNHENPSRSSISFFRRLGLFSACSLEILYALASDPTRSIYQREAAREARVSVGSANRLLRSLLEWGLVEREKRGKLYLYRFNVDNVVARQLKILFTILELEELVEELKPLVRRVILFGSCAEGRDVKESDVDLFILTNEKELVSKIIGQYGSRRRLAPLIVNADEFTRLKDENKPFYSEVMRGITLWERE